MKQKINKITYNGVEYDRGNMPEEIRGLIEKHESTDWRKVSRNQRKEQWQKSTLTHKIISIVFLADLGLVIPLAFYSYFTGVSITVELFGMFGFIYLGFLFALIGSGLYLINTNKSASMKFSKNIFSRVLQALLGLFGISILVSAAVLFGMPAVMHHLTSSDGSVELTVSAKHDRYSKHACSPRLIMREFTGFLSRPICPGKKAYESISVGDTVKISGQVSPFGVKAKYLYVIEK